MWIMGAHEVWASYQNLCHKQKRPKMAISLQENCGFADEELTGQIQILLGWMEAV